MLAFSFKNQERPLGRYLKPPTIPHWQKPVARTRSAIGSRSIS
jgi:hypothetical protein